MVGRLNHAPAGTSNNSSPDSHKVFLTGVNLGQNFKKSFCNVLKSVIKVCLACSLHSIF